MHLITTEFSASGWCVECVSVVNLEIPSLIFTYIKRKKMYTVHMKDTQILSRPEVQIIYVVQKYTSETSTNYKLSCIFSPLLVTC